MKLAYLVNQYPKVSHTFIRREIAAIESLGLEVDRFTLRGTKEPLGDEADEAERRRTRALLDAGAAGLTRAGLWMGVRRPRRLFKAAQLAYRVGRRSDRGLLRHAVYLAEACALASLVERSGCEHVHAHFGTNSATVAMLCHELGGPPFSFTVHGPEEFDKPDLIALREKIERCSFALAVSSYGLSQLYRRARFRDWRKLHVVRCGVDASFFDSPRSPVPETPRLVSVGRLSSQKGQLLLVEAAAELARRGVWFELVLVGDGELRDDVETAIAHHGLGDRIRITGWADGERVRKEILDARALVLPSFAEGLPVVLMEAFALGRPVISTFVAGIPELVVPGRSGWLVPAGSVTALAGAMREALTARAQDLDRMAAEGERRVRDLHDVRTSALALTARVKTAHQSRRRRPKTSRNADGADER
jgi:glycosyltransferase involved in cell wall biosynthesis